MHIQKLDSAKLFEAYGIQVQMLYPWEGVVEPPFGAAWAVVPPGGSTKHHAHQEGETFFFVKGRGVMRIGDDSTEVQTGDVVFQRPFQQHTLENTADEDLLFLTVWWEDLRLWAGRREEGKAERPARTMVSAAPPTPNGDLHVGHLSGPYLAGDIHARYLRLRGVDARYIFGTDDNQSYTKTNGVRLGLGPQEAGDKLAGEIKATLEAAGIELAEFVRPNASPHHVRMTREFFRKLYDDGHLEARETLSPYCETCERYLYEAYIRGRCPHCGSPSGGNLCEDCGRPNDCVDLLDAVCTQCGEPPARRSFTRLFFPLSRWADELREFHLKVGMNPSLRSLCEQVIAAGLPDMTVTHVTDWGIPVPVEGFEDQRIFVWCEMAPRYFSYAQHLGDWEAYWKSDDAEFVHCFGFDNGFYYAVFLPAMWMAYDRNLKLPAAFIMNEFYRLDGLKFSTSRRHAIWGRELLADVPADVMRFYLSWTAPEVEGTNFTLEDFQETCDRELGAWEDWLSGLWQRVGRDFGGKVPSTGDWTEEHRRFFNRLEELSAEAAAAYEARTFSPQRAARVLCELVREARRFGRAQESWRRVPARGEERRTAAALELLAAKTLATLAAPILPELAARLWRDLGFKTEIGEHRWEERPSWVPSGQMLENPDAPYFRSVRESLAARKQPAA
ncbi:MAG TPA: class I tRNA ligase family protein [Thermoanaerobaculia bacterium]